MGEIYGPRLPDNASIAERIVEAALDAAPVGSATQEHRIARRVAADHVVEQLREETGQPELLDRGDPIEQVRRAEVIRFMKQMAPKAVDDRRWRERNKPRSGRHT